MISSRSTKPKLKKIPKLSFKTQMVLWRKRSVRIFSTDQRKLGFNIQIFLIGDGDSKDYNEVKGIYGMCGKDGRRQRKVQARRGYNSGRRIGISKLSVTE